MTRGFWLIALSFTACGPKAPPQPAAPFVGWNAVTREGVSLGECYYPVDFGVLGVGDRRIARQGAMDAMIGHWRGQREDGVSFSPEAIERLETVLLGKPEAIEPVAAANLQQCLAARNSGDNAAWASWLRALPDSLTVGECRTAPLRYTLYDYLDIGRDWHVPASVCAGDRIQISASEGDYYRIADKGPWINVAGDPAAVATATTFPCHLDGCLEGQLLMRFTSDDHATYIVPVGLLKVWEAPAHGTIEVMINDSTWFDNAFKKEGSMIHHTSITYQPAH